MTKQLTIKLLDTVAAMDKAIVSIQKRGKKLDDDIQLVGLSALAHLDKCGDLGPLTRLFFAMPKGSRTNALMDWAQTFGKVTVNTGDDRKEKPFCFSKTATTDMQGAADKPWYDCKKPLDPALEFDFVAKLNALLKSATKEGVKLKEGQTDLIAKARALVNA